MTSAPMSASSIVQKAGGSRRVRSSTRIPLSGIWTSAQFSSLRRRHLRGLRALIGHEERRYENASQQPTTVRGHDQGSGSVRRDLRPWVHGPISLPELPGAAAGRPPADRRTAPADAPARRAAAAPERDRGLYIRVE